MDEPTTELPIVGASVDLHSPRVRRLLFGGIAVALVVIGGLAVASLGAATASLEVVGASAAVTVRTADLGGELYRVRPAGKATEDGRRIRLEVGGGPVELVLATGVTWDLGLQGSAAKRTIDLTGGRFRAVTLGGGATHVDLRLPRPDGTLAVTVTGGVETLDVHTAGREPVRVRVGSGAGRVVLAGENHGGAGAGKVFTPDGWAGAGNRIDFDAAAGMAQLTVSATT